MSLLNITNAVVEQALRDIRIHREPVPEAFVWHDDSVRGHKRKAEKKHPKRFVYRTQPELEADWPNLPLEERVGMVACLIGPSISPEPQKIITLAYLSLCIHGKLPEATRTIRSSEVDDVYS